MQRAESFVVLRRKPVKVRSSSFLLRVSGVVANGFTGIRHLVLDHQFPFGDYVEAQDRGLYYPVAFEFTADSW